MIEDKDGTSWASVSEYFFIGVLDGCGCGNSKDLGKRALKVFLLFASESDDRREVIYGDLASEVLAHWMDSKELIEHGGSIGGSWLTDKGKEVYAEVQRLQKLCDECATTAE